MKNTIEDKNFDDLVDRFLNKVYESEKGKLRLELIKNDFEDFLPRIMNNQKAEILDIGGGLGQVSRMMANLDHSVTMCDISEKMLKKAEEFTSEKEKSNITFVQSSLQEIMGKINKKSDFIIFHAVLEWMAEPDKAINYLFELLKTGGHVSILFYNKNGIIYHNILRGNLKKIFKEDFVGFPNSLTPKNPILLEDVKNWLSAYNFEIISQSGIRCFYDYINWQVKDKISYEDILNIEKKYYRKEPYASMGRYIHLIAKKK